MRASAATPRYYRDWFHRDLLVDLTTLVGSWREGREGDGAVLENLAYTMARQADSDLTEDISVWLDSFDSPTAISDAAGELLNLWNGNTQTTVAAKKNE